MMFYQKIPPNRLLKEYIVCYYIWECNVSQQPLHIVSPPAAYTSIVFNYGDAYSVASNMEHKQQVPRFFLTGQATCKYELNVSGIIGMLGIVFLPAALTTLFNIPVFELVNERVNLKDLLGSEMEEIGNMIADATDHSTRIQLIEAFLLGQLFHHKLQFDAIDRAANKIVQANGNFDIDELVAGSGMSRRNFERKFYQKVGLSPKYYGKIRRVGHVCNIIAHSKDISWQDIIYNNGYFDQAHFIKEFKEFMGESPSKYIKNNIELGDFSL